MYRSEFLWNNIDSLISDDEIWPVCVPSYNKPNAQLIKNIDSSIPMYIFVRPEQFSDYKKYKSKSKGIVKIKDVQEIGITRHRIVEWAQYKGFDNIFMIDDDVTALHFLVPWYGNEDGTGKPAMKRYRTLKHMPEELDKRVLKMWMWYAMRCDDRLTISGPGNLSDWWNINNENSKALYNSSSTLVAVHLNIKNLTKFGLNYKDTRQYGTEDYTLQYDVMRSGLFTSIFKDIAYRVPNVGAGRMEQQKVIDKYNENIRLFMENAMSPEDNDRVTTKVSKSGIPSIKFNWSKWRAEEYMMYNNTDISENLIVKGVM